jgi:lysyl-tRNA synthetase class 2
VVSDTTFPVELKLVSDTAFPRWRPAAPLEILRLRARLLARVRAFFQAREVMEVETPLLGSAAATDPHLASIAVAEGGATRYLQTSPELAMKRLLAAGSGPIYQVCKAFRAQERGRLHNPEFTLLEWYRPGFDHHTLMDEVEALLASVLGNGPAERLSYAEAFRRHAGLDPHETPLAHLRSRAAALGADPALAAALERDGCLDLVLTHAVQPALGPGLCFVYDFPATQASLARIAAGYAQRFEAFVGGLEVANGYRELTDTTEQRRRFEADNERRRALGLPQVPIDERLLAALAHGLPECAGVALGFDRLVMLAAGARSVSEVLAFPAACA